MTLITMKRPLWPYLALYMQFSWLALFTKATPTNYRICHDFKCYINKRETPTTCLTNHKSSRSHHIMPLVINNLGGGHTHTHTYICIQTLRTKAISRNQSCASLQPAPAWFKKLHDIKCGLLFHSTMPKIVQYHYLLNYTSLFDLKYSYA